MACADDLLEQAAHLARRERTRPKQASLRRAVSTAYYALFHLLISDAVMRWKVPSHRAQLARIFEHGRMKAASARTARMQFADCDPSEVEYLRIVADAFGELYDDRQSADYDNSRVWSRTDVVERIRMATEAFESWKAIRHHPIADDFLLSLFVKER